MKNLTRILVGIDYSECSENALREGSRIANWNDAKLLCVHVFDDEIMADFRAAPTFDEKSVVEAAQRRLELFVAEKIGTGHEIACQIKIGHPFKELLGAVESFGAELLVLGARGFQQRDPNRTGAFASRCIRKAPAEVLLVRRHQHEPFQSVVACVDFSENSKRAAHRAAQIALQDKARLEFAHVYESPIFAAGDMGGLGPALPEIDNVEISRTLESQLSAFADEVSAENDGVEIHTSVSQHLGVSNGIVQRLKETEADLVVLGTRGRTGWKKLLLGTTAERLLHDAPCSALTVKPEGFTYSVS